MTLRELLSVLPFAVGDIPDTEIRNITENSSEAGENSLFICIRGFRSDGHAYAADAYRRGCRAFLAERELPELPDDAAVIVIGNTHTALGRIASEFYGHPSRELRLIGITGTKGKTTTACMIAQILTQSGISCGYIGTNGITYGTVRQVTKNTTPDAITLQKTLRGMVDAGCRAAVVEVSSQALKLDRVAGTKFETCLFTNLSPDHIGEGEHSDLAEYIACKHRLFTDYGAQTVIYNADDPHAGEMLSGISALRTVSCSLRQNADFAAEDVRSGCSPGRLGLTFLLRSPAAPPALCELSLIGHGNVSNALLAVACAAQCFGVPITNAIRILKRIAIAGRSEIFHLPCGAAAVIDYAHNGVSLRQLLTDLREYTPGRLICLFGSVGERTRLRRFELGRVAAELSDLSILTSDNPGNETPEQIIADIAEAFRESSTPYLCIPDREQAIREGVRLLKRGDILVLAGKGHEAYQLVGQKKLPFSERELLLKYAEETENLNIT